MQKKAKRLTGIQVLTKKFTESLERMKVMKVI